ncbi:hypothetical protein SRB5_52410 [Streptomyces sp. RB5]|uniref:G domain-containing protein n=1 Tax=Streptomyces smaragdinus TaxID=2585196 RepID=A0A7K0CP41_9ACTN|nr:GTPase [Streptomyces smaragdinus]MQY15063.1 hypothetical protein [Streptomyces smaragdinus]
MWDDGLIARRAQEWDEGGQGVRLDDDPWLAAQAWHLAPEAEPAPPGPRTAADGEGAAPGRESACRISAPLRARLEALRELVGLSRTRLDGRTLAEAGRVLDEAAARQRLSLEHTVVAVAGTTGSGKSSLFNALAGCALAEVGPRRPTTDEASACAWRGPQDDAPFQLLERLGLPPRALRPQEDDPALRGLVLLDLPDFDSAVDTHRADVERLLGRVDAVVWVVDPEKYADAVLHERYLRPLAGYAEVTFVVLNQADRLPGAACDQVLDDLRRLLDEDGLALGEHGEPGAMVLAVSAQTGDGVADLRGELAGLVSERGAAERRLTADLDGAVARLEEVYVSEGPAVLSGPAREEFEDRLAEAVGARAAGLAAERQWRAEAERAYGSCWGQVFAWWRRRRGDTAEEERGERVRKAGRRGASGGAAGGALSASRAVVEQAVRAVATTAAAGLPGPWAQAVHEASGRGAAGLAEELDAAAGVVGAGRVPERPRWWSVVGATQNALFMLQMLCLLWLLCAATGLAHVAWQMLLGFALVCSGSGPLTAIVCRLVARGPARRHGQDTERRLREAAAGCGRARVLEPVAAELLRYKEVREQYAVAAGGVARV